MTERRGLHFLVGLAVLWMLWRLRADGLLFHAAAYAAGEPVGNPGALITGFLIEAVIAVGAVTTLVLSGIWDALYLAGGQASGAMQQIRGYLSSLQGAKDAPPVDAADEPADDSGKPAVATVADAIAALDRNVQAVDRNVAKLAERIDALESTEGEADGAT